MSYKIASFNVCKLSYRSDKEIKKNYDLIKTIIENEKIDIVALQEVFTEHVLSRIFGPKHVANDWDYAWAAPQSHSATAAEGYAFAWRKSRVQPSYTILPNGEHRIYKPRIVNQYQKLSYGQLIRNPFYARFIPIEHSGGSFLEFRLINVHIRFGKDEHAPDSEGAVKLRKHEFEILARSVYPKVSDRVYGQADGELYYDDITYRGYGGCRADRPSYTILLGDYNLNLNRVFTSPPYVPDSATDPRVMNVYRHPSRNRSYGVIQGQPTDFYAADNKIIQTAQEALSTLKKRSEQTANGETALANNYDHFSFDSKRFAEHLNISVHCLNAIETYYPPSPDLQESPADRYRREISDHLPVILTVDVKRKELS